MTSKASLKLDMLPAAPPSACDDDLGELDACCAAAMLSAAEETDPLLLGGLIVSVFVLVLLGEVLPDMLFGCCKLLLDRERMVLARTWVPGYRLQSISKASGKVTINNFKEDGSGQSRSFSGSQQSLQCHTRSRRVGTTGRTIQRKSHLMTVRE